MSPELTAKLERIRLLLLDVDGVMTDGSINYTGDGDEIKRFNVRDGFGIRLLMDAGIAVGIVTGRSSPALKRRCENLGIDILWDNVTEKAAVLSRILSDAGVSADETAFMGDDLIDLPLMRRVGAAIAVADAHEVVRECADMITERSGGHGAVREACEAILTAKGLWPSIVEKYKGDA